MHVCGNVPTKVFVFQSVESFLHLCVKSIPGSLKFLDELSHVATITWLHEWNKCHK